MELNFKTLDNLLTFIDILVEETCENHKMDWYKYDRPDVATLKVGQWGYLAIRTLGSHFDMSIEKHDAVCKDFSNVIFTGLISHEQEDLYTLSLYKR